MLFDVVSLISNITMNIFSMIFLDVHTVLKTVTFVPNMIVFIILKLMLLLPILDSITTLVIHSNSDHSYAIMIWMTKYSKTSLLAVITMSVLHPAPYQMCIEIIFIPSVITLS